uniref:Uncharacterized protein n=1 Tax=Oryza punctata TaxID=4537 RepID=A0A0E0KKU1_ORYPU
MAPPPAKGGAKTNKRVLFVPTCLAK